MFKNLILGYEYVTNGFCTFPPILIRLLCSAENANAADAVLVSKEEDWSASSLARDVSISNSQFFKIWTEQVGFLDKIRWKVWNPNQVKKSE